MYQPTFSGFISLGLIKEVNILYDDRKGIEVEYDLSAKACNAQRLVFGRGRF